MSIQTFVACLISGVYTNSVWFFVKITNLTSLFFVILVTNYTLFTVM